MSLWALRFLACVLLVSLLASIALEVVLIVELWERLEYYR